MGKYIYSTTGKPIPDGIVPVKERDGSQWVPDINVPGGWAQVTELVQTFGLVSPAVQAQGSPVMDKLTRIEAKLDQLLAK